MQLKPSTIGPTLAESRPIVRTAKPGKICPETLRDSGNAGALTFRNAVACLDNSRNASFVFRHTKAVASGLDVPLKLVHVLQSAASEASPGDPIEWQIKMREALEYLSRILKSQDSPLVQKSLLLNGVAGEEISRWTSEHTGNLIALTTRCGLENTGSRTDDCALGRTAQMVLDRTVASLLLIPPDGSDDEEIVYRRIVVPLDGSWRAESVLPFAVRIARKHGAELLLAHVISKPEIMTTGLDDAEANDFVMKLNQCNEQNARAYLDRMQSRLASGGIAVRSIVEKEGDVRERLLQIAERRRADLIVMSARGKGAIHNMSCGNVARHIAGHTRCPLLLIRQQMSKPVDHAMIQDQRHGPLLFRESAH